MKKLLFMLLVLVLICVISVSGCAAIRDMMGTIQIEHNKPVGEIYGSTTVG